SALRHRPGKSCREPCVPPSINNPATLPRIAGRRLDVGQSPPAGLRRRAVPFCGAMDYMTCLAQTDRPMTDQSPSAPITQDVMTIPRRLPEGGRVNLVGLTREQFRNALIGAGTPEKQARMRVGQIWQWIYHWGVRDFAAMTNLAKDYRALLADRFEIALPEVVTRQVSADGTRKYLLRIAGGHEVETVYIPEENRGTLCISSQVGCTLTCSFCHTG